MVVFSKLGAVSLGLTVLIFIVLALIVLIILSSAIRNSLIGGLTYFGSVISQIIGGSGGSSSIGTTRTSFIAYYCPSVFNAQHVCTQTPKRFPSGPSLWYIDYNGQNSSANVSAAIGFTTTPGNFSYSAYNINYSGSIICSNQSSGVTSSGEPIHAGYASAGIVKILYYGGC